MAAPAKVFWPTTAHPAPSGDVYGWNTRELAVVAAVVDPDTHPRVEVMHRLSSSASTERLVQQAGSLPRVIGARTKTSLFINGRLVRGQNLVLFRPPRPRDLHFLSLESINLHRAPTSPDPLAARLSSIRLADSENELATAIEQINTCDEFAALITGRNVHRAPIGALLLHRIHSLTAPFRLARLRWIRNRCAPLVTRLASVSATAAQIQLRTLQLEDVSNEMIRARQFQGLNSWGAYSPYVAFWNCVWLFLNDAIFGYTFGVYVLYNRHYLAARIDEAIQLGFDSLVDPGLAWLDSWPVGLKLNAQLSGFFRLAFLQISVSFLAGVQLISRAGVLPLILSIIGILGCLSMSFLLAMCTDLFTLLTVNVSISYRLMAAVQRFQWSALYHLFTLFRGKRRNFLRRRIDSWEYEIDQLILGTVLFTLVVFLLPTVLVYYAFFTCLRVGMLSIQACIEVMLACMNYFPLFAILLRLKDPERLPGGVYLSVADKGLASIARSATSDEQEAEQVLMLCNQSLPASMILAHFGRYLSRMSRHYHPARVLWHVLSGRHLDRMASRDDDRHVV